MEILPRDQKYWQHLVSSIENKASSLGFSKIETPVISRYEIIEKMPSLDPYVSIDDISYLRQGDQASDYVLQADATANILNAYHNYLKEESPYLTKLYHIGSAFFGKDPQYINLFNAELIGDENPTSDALLILLAWQIIKKLKLEETLEIQLNSVGCSNCRNTVNRHLENFYTDNQASLCPVCNELEKKDVLKSANCQTSECKEMKKSSPQIVDIICPECKTHLTGLLEHLDDLEIPYNLNPNLFYNHPHITRTVFDIISPDDSQVFGRGNRHDRVLEKFGGEPKPAAGFQLLLDPIMELLKERNDVSNPALDIYLVQLGAQAKKKILTIASRLSDQGFKISCAFHKDSLKNHLTEAEQAGAKIALIMGQREAIDNSIIFRDIAQCSQETISMNELDRFITKHFTG